MNKWYDLEEHEPEDGEIVLCCDIYNPIINLGLFVEESCGFELVQIEEDVMEPDSLITHWMPLPDPPELD